jgi:hypothetical protein
MGLLTTTATSQIAAEFAPTPKPERMAGNLQRQQFSN